MSNMKIAVIGANGFIGSHLVEALMQEKNIELKLFGKSKSSRFPNYKPIEPDNTHFLHDNFRDVDYIFYLASETIPANSWNDPMLEVQKNLIPFLQFLQTISTIGVKKVGYLSSAGTVYGLSEELLTENTNTHPFSPYGIMKLTMENYLNYFYHKTGLKYDIFRISNVYGEGQDTSKGLGLINTLLEKATILKKIQVFGDGNNVRNFIYVKDVAEILTQVATSRFDANHLLNVSSDDSLSLNDIIHLMQKDLGMEFSVEKLEQRGSDNKKTLVDNRKLRSLLPEFKFTSIRDGIKLTHDHIVSTLKEKLK